MVDEDLLTASPFDYTHLLQLTVMKASVYVYVCIYVCMYVCMYVCLNMRLCVLCMCMYV